MTAPGIEIDPDQRLFVLSTNNSSYVVQVADVNDVSDVPICGYIGPATTADAARDIARLSRQARHSFASMIDGREELPLQGGSRFVTPALAAEFRDGVRTVEWRFEEHRTTIENGTHTLELRFRDRVKPLAVSLFYRVHDDAAVLERWTAITNLGDQEAIDLHRIDSAAVAIPALKSYRLSHLAGMWGGETQLLRDALPVGETVLGSRRGTTSHQANPWVAVDDGSATETSGEVVAIALAWSGSWRVGITRLPNGPVQVTAGVGHDGFGPYRLAAGEVFATPVAAMVYSNAGFGAASRDWHDHVLANVLPRADELRPVLYNSWEATHFDVNEQNQAELAGRAADLGVELFVVDDGWFGARLNDKAGLGDWYVNTERFPKGLGPLIDTVHDLGMQFGIWVEPEMVNPDSDLYREHPDWVYHFPERTRTEHRNQLVLNVARPDVAEWMFTQVDQLLSDNDIQYVKWDMNRPLTEVGWPDGPDNPGRLWVDHIRNLYGVIDRLRANHPNVAFESCSGGGGRVDLGILSRTDQVWTSDNTDADDRLHIQHGFSQIYPARVMSCWVTDVPNFLHGRTVPLRYRFHSAMAGILGVGGDLTKWSDADLAEAREHITQ